MNGDEAMVKRLLELFCEKSPEQLAEIGQFIEQKDWENTETAAHSFKAQLGYLSSEYEIGIAKSLEIAAMEHNEQEARKLFFELKKVTTALIAEITQ